MRKLFVDAVLKSAIFIGFNESDQIKSNSAGKEAETHFMSVNLSTSDDLAQNAT